MKKKPAPLYIDSAALCEWIIGRLGDDERILARSICRHAIDLHESLALALNDRRREPNIDRADEILIALRADLRMAVQVGYLSAPQVIHADKHVGRIHRALRDPRAGRFRTRIN